MAPRKNDGSSSLLSENGNHDRHAPQSQAATCEEFDLLGLDAPATSTSAATEYPTFSTSNHAAGSVPASTSVPAYASTSTSTSTASILSLASELTQGALELEAAKSMKLNDAFLSLDKMRMANLEIEFGHAIDHKKCVQCLRSLPPHKRPLSITSRVTPLKILKAPITSISRKKRKPCLLCGNPTCPSHVDKSFAKSKVIICVRCAPLFSLDFIIECVSHKHDMSDPSRAQRQRQQIKHMIDVYDRVMLMLEYAAQYIDEIALKLEQMTKKEDRIGLGCNTSGVASGVAGVAAAACFVTPAGPPLLIASLLFSGASQMTSQGNKMVNYYSTPNKIAFKIISLYNLCKSVLTVTTVLRDALLKDHIDLEKYVENMIKETEEAALEMKTGFELDEDEEGDEDEDEYYNDEDENDHATVTSTVMDDDTVLDDGIGNPISSIGMKHESDDDDEESWSSFTSATTSPTKSGDVTAFSDMSMSVVSEMPTTATATALEKIDESKEFQNTTATTSLDGGGMGFANSSDDDSELDGASGIMIGDGDTSGADGDGDGGVNGNVNGNANGNGTHTQQQQDAKPIDTILANTLKSGIVMAAPVAIAATPTSPASSSSASTSPTKSAAGDAPTGTALRKRSPSKQEQIDELKKANHFLEREDNVGSLARFYSRSSLAGSSLMSAAAVTMMAGAALSAVHFAFEANNLAATIKRIQAGSPSKRAKVLRLIKQDVKNLPRTHVIVEEWDKYLEVLMDRQMLDL